MRRSQQHSAIVPQARLPARRYLFFGITVIAGLLCPGFAQDTIAHAVTLDTVSVLQKNAAAAKVFDSTNDSLKNTVDFDSSTTIGAGLGLSVGSTPLFALWKKGLPHALADFSLSETSFNQAADSTPLAFSLKEDPDIYNMIFPISISFGRCFPQFRLGTALSFSMLSKKYTSSIATTTDSSLRRVDIRQQLAVYAVTLDFLYGRKIPARYFSVDGVDRTDAVLGISIAPLVALNKTSSIRSNAADSRFTALADSIAYSVNSFSSYGIALGWRAGIMTLRRLSKQGGVEAGISYYGVWSGGFRASGTPLLETQISKRGSAVNEIANVSHRVEISVAFVRKVF